MGGRSAALRTPSNLRRTLDSAAEGLIVILVVGFIAKWLAG